MKEELLKRFEAVVEEAMRTRAWLTIEIIFQRGVPTLFRKITTEKLLNEGAPHARPFETR